MLKITPEALKAILLNAEKLSDKFPYEYICWKNLLADTEPESIDIKAILNKNLSPAEISETDLENFTAMNLPSTGLWITATVMNSMK